MTQDEIEIGRTYRMKPGTLDRRVLDILWHPAGGLYISLAACEFGGEIEIGAVMRPSFP